MTILYWIIFALSLLGWITLFSSQTRFKIPIPLIPAFFFAASGTVLCLMGILNVLPLASRGIILFGAAYFLWSIHQKVTRQKCIADLLAYFKHPSTIVFVILSVFASITLSGRMLIGYDDYSHWATIVRCMQTFQRLPTFLDAEYIEFQSYPPHAACCIYFICDHLGLDDRFYLPCQAIAKCAGIVSLFVLATPKKRWSSVFFALLCSGLFISFLRSDMLHVDALLASYAIAGLAAVFVWKDDLYKQTPKIFIYLSALVLTKHSGIFFCLVVILAFYLQSRKYPFNVKVTLSLFGATALVFLLWRKHAEYVFLNSKHTPHAISLGVYYMHLRENLPGIFQTICLFLKRSLSPSSNSGIYALITVLALDFFSPSVNNHKSLSKYQTSLFALSIFLSYSASLFAMYLFSMSNYELLAQNMKDYYRYMVPCSIVLYAIAGCRLHTAFETRNFNQAFKICTTAACILLGLGICQYQQLAHFDRFWHKTLWAEQYISSTISLQKEYQIPYHSSIVLVYPNDTLSYNYDGYIGKYVFLPSDYSFMSEAEYNAELSENFPAAGTYVVNLVSNTVEHFGK